MCNDARVSIPGRAAARLKAELRHRDRLRQRATRHQQENQQLRQERLALRQERDELRQEVARLRTPAVQGPPAGVEEASWLQVLRSYQRTGWLLRETDRAALHPRRLLLRKLHNYTLARSHGVPTPHVRALYERLEDIPWDDLPERFVLKSDRGAGGHGVLPLRSLGGRRWEMLDGSGELDLEAIFRRYEKKGLTRPFFIEDVLPGTGVVLPDDVKLYCFQGTVGQVMLRRMEGHQNLRAARYRYLRPDGSDLGEVLVDSRRIDPSIPAPPDLETMVRVAQELSVHVPVPFVRVDLYQVPQGILLGELTQAPGGTQAYRPDHDQRLGYLMERARAQVETELAMGEREFANRFGPHDSDVTRELPPLRY